MTFLTKLSYDPLDDTTYLIDRQTDFIDDALDLHR